MKRTIRRISDELSQITKSPWESVPMDKTGNEWLIRPKNLLNPGGVGSYRFGIHVVRHSKWLLAGLYITHNRELARQFADSLAREEFTLARFELASYFRRIKGLELLVEFKKKDGTINLTAGRYSPHYISQLSAVPFELEYFKEERAFSRE